MNDPVSRELEERARARQPWVPALVAAVFVHASVAVALVVLPDKPRRALSLPSVQVRLGALSVPLPEQQPAPGPPPAPPVREAPAPPRAAPAVEPRVAPPASPRPAPARTPPPPQRQPQSTPAPATAQQDSGAATDPAGRPDPAPSPATDLPSGSGVGLGSGSRGATDEHFPYAYYLDRILATIQENWFRPAAPSDTRCRIRCRLDRSGRILEAGIESPSGLAAFDRAALRAVYAAAPFPPLPQGFGGSTLTLYLEFGQ